MSLEAPATTTKKAEDTTTTGGDAAAEEKKPEEQETGSSTSAEKTDTESPEISAWLKSIGTSIGTAISSAAAEAYSFSAEYLSAGVETVTKAFGESKEWDVKNGQWHKNELSASLASLGFPAGMDLMPANLAGKDVALDKGPTPALTFEASNLDYLNFYIDNRGAESSVRNYRGPNGETITSTDTAIDATKDGVQYHKDKKTGLESEQGQGWKYEETQDGKRILTRADGARMELSMGERGHPKEATITFPDGTTQTIHSGRMLRRMLGGVTITQSRGDTPAEREGKDPKEAADEKAKEEASEGVHALDNGAIRINMGDVTIIANHDGRKVIDLGDGNRVRVQPDGSYQVVDKEGNHVNSELVTNENGMLTIKDRSGKTVTVQLTGEGAGVVSTQDGVVVSGQGNTVTVQNANGKGTVAVLETTPAGTSTLTEGTCAAQSSCELNADGTPKRTDTGAPALDTTTRVTTVSAATGQVTSGDPSATTPELQTNPDDPNQFTWQAAIDALGNALNPFKWNWNGDGNVETPSGSTFWGDLWDGVTSLWDGAVEIAKDAISFGSDSGWHEVGGGDDAPVAAQAQSLVSAAEGVAARISGLSPNQITSGDIGALLAAYADLAAIRGSLLAAGAFSSLAAVEQALAKVNGELGDAQVATTLRNTAERVSGVVPGDVLNALFKMAHGADWNSIKHVLQKYHVPNFDKYETAFNNNPSSSKAA